MAPHRTELKLQLVLLLVASSLLIVFPCAAQTESAPVSPKRAWGEFEVVEEEGEASPFRQTILWIPNRILDFIDIFRIDLGIGASIGGAVRLTEHANLSHRRMHPASLRVGGFGRDWPFLWEDVDDVSFGENKHISEKRTICPGEFGASIELGIVGGYSGICLDELFDFLGGIFLFDFKEDDYH